MAEGVASADGTRLPQHLGQPKDRSSISPHCPLEAWGDRLWWGMRHGKDRVTKGSTKLQIAAWGLAVAYLLALVVGAVGVLSVLVWLFRETPGAPRRTGRGSVKGAWGAPAAPERPARPRRRSSRNAPSMKPHETTSGRSPEQDPASSARVLRQDYGLAAQRRVELTEGRNR